MAEYAVNLNNGKTDEKGIFRLLGKLFNQSGVIESTALAVAAQSSPDMTVKVSGSAASDNAVFLTGNADCYHGWNTASYNVIIQTNSTGVTHLDAIVAYIDTAAGSATANNPGGLKFLDVRSSATDGVTKATSADITASAVGTKPYLRLADVTVGNGVSSINSGNVVDARVFAGINYTLSAPAWTAYTPTWSSTATSPVIGNGSIAGHYTKIGRLVTVHIELIIGSTSTFGTGAWLISLPFTAATSYPSDSGAYVGSFGTTHAGHFGSADYGGDVTTYGPNLNVAIPRFPDGTTPAKQAGCDGTHPFSWVATDFLTLALTYESAS